MIYKITSLKTFFIMILLFSSLLSSNEIIVIDVRSFEEVKTGVIQDAIHIEWTKIEEEKTNLDISKEQPIYLYCRSGNRSGRATKILEKIGYTNAINAGGIKEAAKKLDKKIVKYSE